MRNALPIAVIAATMQLGWSCVAVAANDPLDAPLSSSMPTTRSELMRGRDAASRCAANVHGALRGVEQCLNEALADNRTKMGRDYEAFETGFFFEAWSVTDDRISQENGTAVLGDPAQLMSDEKQYWQMYRSSMRMVRLSDAQVMEVLKAGAPIPRMIAESHARYGD